MTLNYFIKIQIKTFIVLAILIFSINVYADELSRLDLNNSSSSDWRLERTNLYFENDIFVHTDSQYTSGLKLSNVYFVPHSNVDFLKTLSIFDKNKAHFLSIGISQQIYTPADTNASQVLVNDRPYAGWTYLEIGMHQSSQTELDSFVLEIGLVGKASGGELTQKTIHRLIGNDIPNGWSNQLNNELGVNLIYQHKKRYLPKKFLGIESNIVPFILAEVGNVKTQVNTGALLRFGLNPLKDFGSSSIDIGGENGIPIRTNCLCSKYEPWSFTVNLSASVQALAHNIFLDGNTFTQSHSIKKENFIANAAYGFSLRYNHLAFDYIDTFSTKHFAKETSNHQFGTILFSYLY